MIEHPSIMVPTKSDKMYDCFEKLLKHSPDFKDKMKNVQFEDPKHYVRTHTNLTIDLVEDIYLRIKTPSNFKPLNRTHNSLF